MASGTAKRAHTATTTPATRAVKHKQEPEKANNPFGTLTPLQDPLTKAPPLFKTPPPVPPATVAVPPQQDYLHTLLFDQNPDLLQTEARRVAAELYLKYPGFDPVLMRLAIGILQSSPIGVDRAQFLILVCALTLPLLRERLASGCNRARLEPFLLKFRDECSVYLRRRHTFFEPANVAEGKTLAYPTWLLLLVRARFWYWTRFDYGGRYRAAHRSARNVDWIRAIPTSINFDSNGYVYTEPARVADVRLPTPVSGPIQAGVTGCFSIMVALAAMQTEDKAAAAAALHARNTEDPRFMHPGATDMSAVHAIVYAGAERVPKSEARHRRNPHYQLGLSGAFGADASDSDNEDDTA